MVISVVKKIYKIYSVHCRCGTLVFSKDSNSKVSCIYDHLGRRKSHQIHLHLFPYQSWSCFSCYHPVFAHMPVIYNENLFLAIPILFRIFKQIFHFLSISYPIFSLLLWLSEPFYCLNTYSLMHSMHFLQTKFDQRWGMHVIQRNVIFPHFFRAYFLIPWENDCLSHVMQVFWVYTKPVL